MHIHHLEKILHCFGYGLQPDEDQTDESPDQISELTGDVLAYILLCKLSLKEAARMCSVSRKWRCLYRKITRNLIFDDGSRNLNTDYLLEEEEIRQSKFVKHVNESLRLNELIGVIDKLGIRCGLDCCFWREIDKWVKLAFSKHVERFDLDLLVLRQIGGGGSGGYYTLTRELVIGIEGGFKSLEKLRLKGVDINEKVVSVMLNRCTNLKQLAIVDSPSLVSFKVAGSEESMLRHLELSGWFKSVEISDVISLVSLTLHENNSKEVTFRIINLQVENVPSLVDLHISGGFADSYILGNMYNLFTQLAACLKSLTVKITSNLYFHGEQPFVPIMTCVEKFVLQTMYGYSSIHLVGMMTVRFPSLREFVLQISWKWREKTLPQQMYVPYEDFWFDQLNYTKDELKYTKEVKIAGYYGDFEDVNLATFFLKCGVGIERLTIDPRDQTNLLLGRLPQNHESCESDIEIAATIRAYEQLPGRVPPGVELVIL